MVNKTIECIYFDFSKGRNILIGQKSLVITENPYPPPSNICVESNGSSQIIFTWDEVKSQLVLNMLSLQLTVECIPTLPLIKTSHVIYNQI